VDCTIYNKAIDKEGWWEYPEHEIEYSSLLLDVTVMIGISENELEGRTYRTTPVSEL
jgi:hypothetical protein